MLLNVAAVDHEPVRVLALAADGEIARGQVAGDAAALSAAVYRDDARLEAEQIDIAAAVERLAGHLFRIDHIAHLRADCLDVNRRGRHFDGIGERAQLKGDIDPQRRVRIELDVVLPEVLERRLTDFKLIAAMLAEFTEALSSTAAQAKFKMFSLNQWVNTARAWLHRELTR